MNSTKVLTSGSYEETVAPAPTPSAGIPEAGAKKPKIGLIIGLSVVGLAVVGGIIYFATKGKAKAA